MQRIERAKELVRVSGAIAECVSQVVGFAR